MLRQKFKYWMLGLASLVSMASYGATELSQQVDAYMTSAMQEHRIPGAALAVVDNGQPILLQTYGISNLELATPVAPNSVFELASLTKQLTAALLLTLEQEGKLSVDDSLEQHLGEVIPDMPEQWKSITLAQLLSHSAGLTHRFEPEYHDSLLLNYDRELMLDGAKQQPISSEPGTDWSYSDQGYFLLGLVIETLTNKQFYSLLHERFFKPLKMKQTHRLDQKAIIPGRVANYSLDDQGEWINGRRDWQFALMPHFGVMSSIEDMLLWEQSLVRQELLPSSVYRRLTQPIYVFHQAEQKLLAYGAGWWVFEHGGHRMLEHSGFTGTAYFRDLTTGLSVILLTNRDHNSGPGAMSLVHEIVELFQPDLDFSQREP